MWDTWVQVWEETQIHQRKAQDLEERFGCDAERKAEFIDILHSLDLMVQGEEDEWSVEDWLLGEEVGVDETGWTEQDWWN